jgi:hypothetical protein
VFVHVRCGVITRDLSDREIDQLVIYYSTLSPNCTFANAFWIVDLALVLAPGTSWDNTMSFLVRQQAN